MALTLTESAKLSLNQLERGVAETFVLQSRVLDRIPLIPIEGNAYAYNAEATLPGAAFRAVNTAYTESTGTYTQTTEALSILGGDADVDRFIVQTRGNIQDQRAAAVTGKVKAANFKYQDAFVNGDNGVDANSFDGLKKRLTGNQVVAAATNGLGPITGGQSFFDALDDLISRVPGGVDALYMNSGILAKVRGSARRIGGWTQQRNDFGVPIDFYNNIPMLNIGQNASGVEIIPQTETQGTASGICSSIYAVKWSPGPEENGVGGITNGGLQVYDLGELQTMPVYRTRIEFYCGLAMFGRGAARLTGVLNS